VLGERVQGPGNLARNTGTHEHIVHAGEHRAVERCEIGHLYLREQVDAHRARLAVLREEDLDEVRENRDSLPGSAHRLLVHREQLVWSACGPATCNEVATDDLRSNIGNREVLDGAPHVAARVAILKTPNEHGVECRARHHTELAGARHGVRQAPVGHGDAHAALDDAWKCLGGDGQVDAVHEKAVSLWMARKGKAPLCSPKRTVSGLNAHHGPRGRRGLGAQRRIE
jgi:hypothetical protein